MTKSVKRTKKKTLHRNTNGKDISGNMHQNLDIGSPSDPSSPLFTTTASKEDSQEWTSVQLEQIELANQLNDYINSFQKKLLSLNFTPTNRELVILFIMYLHPRWRRLVEPMELSCSTWIEAAAYAKLHCGRISAMLGCEKPGSSCIFSTPESRALRDSGYFAPEHPIPEDIEDSTNDDAKSDSAASCTDSTIQQPPTAEKHHDDPVIEDTNTSESISEKPPQSPKRKKKKQQLEAQKKVDATDVIIHDIPIEHKGINLTFLDILVRGHEVKALLSNHTWACSTISLDQVTRLKLEIDREDTERVDTAFGFVEALGSVTVPCQHPKDLEIRWECKAMVLPKIYSGRVDLILGSDFFDELKPRFNIKSRAIHFLGNEVPYCVDQLQ